ncbi:hypothetical protein LguiA_018227 [Lonicera macranthoides]
MTIDDSFKKQGTVPFKWEIRPGVPKVRHQPASDLHHLFVHHDDHHHHHHQQQPDDHKRSFPSTPQKLRPPPSGFYHQPPPELRTCSFRSAPRTRSQCFDQPDIVSLGCFSSPLPRRKDEKKGTHKPKPKPDYTSDLETLSTWSRSTRLSPLPFCNSPSSSSFSSYRSSPRPVSDAEWAGFGLF